MDSPNEHTELILSLPLHCPLSLLLLQGCFTQYVYMVLSTVQPRNPKHIPYSSLFLTHPLLEFSLLDIW